MLRKHGIDLEDSLSDGARTKRLDRSDIDKLMGGDGKGGIFTWREKNRRKARATFYEALAHANGRYSYCSAGLLCVSDAYLECELPLTH